MIRINDWEVIGFEHAIRGMRNPMNSWSKSDSKFYYQTDNIVADIYDTYRVDEIGKNDRELMMKLRNAGTDHRKFMRMITVYADIVAPLYWWKEFDTYKIGTVANSCSTMHKIADKEFTLDDFSHENLQIGGYDNPMDAPFINGMRYGTDDVMDIMVEVLNYYRMRYLKTKEKIYWWQMIQLLPSSYNQKRTVMLNYEVLANMYKSRKNHKLDEWRDFCEWIEELPYSYIITGEENGDTK